MTEQPRKDQVLEPGIYPGLRFEEYLGIKAINWSTLKLAGPAKGRCSMAHLREEQLHPTPSTPRQQSGHALHAAILEPGDFAKRFVVKPLPAERPRKSNVQKEWWKMWEFEHRYHEKITSQDWRRALTLQKRLWAHPTASALLQNAKQRETAIVWRDPETGLMCKARVDILTEYVEPGQTYGWTTIADIKTTRDASPDGLGKFIEEFGTYGQAAMQLHGMDQLGGKRERRWFVIGCEIDPPYEITVGEMTTFDLADGYARYRNALNRYATSLETDVWPGYQTELQIIQRPAWAKRMIDMEEWNDA